MSLNDPIADMLTRIRNALRINKKQVNIKASKICEGIAAVLKNEGYIEDFDRIDDGKQAILRVTLKYDQDGQPAIDEITRYQETQPEVYKNFHAEIKDCKNVMIKLRFKLDHPPFEKRDCID